MGHWEQIGEERLKSDREPQRDWLGWIAVPFAVIFWVLVLAALVRAIGQIAHAIW